MNTALLLAILAALVAIWYELRHTGQTSSFSDLTTAVRELTIKEDAMAIDLTALFEEVTRQGSIADSILTYIQGLSGQPGIDQGTIDTIVASIKANDDRLNAAIPANTPPVP